MISGEWRTITLPDGSTAAARDILAKMHRFDHLVYGEDVLVAVNETGIRLYDAPEKEVERLSVESRCVAELKPKILLKDVVPLFRNKKIAEAVLARFDILFLEEKMSHEDKQWRLLELPDWSLMLAKSMAHYSTRYPGRYNPVAVGIRSNGVYLYREPLSVVCPPREASQFLYLPPRDINLAKLVELFSPNEAAEVTAAFRLNRKWLLNLVAGRKGESDAAGSGFTMA